MECVDYTNYSPSVSTRFPNDHQTFKTENPRSFNTFRRSNSASGSVYRSPTPKFDESREIPYSENTYRYVSQDPRAKTNNKGGSDSYYTDKHYSKEFLSTSKPLSEMIIKHT